ncbi:NACHT domain-containing protein [Streptomyces sp. NPDC018031]|uniref:NACHT domain-containing protein n=1 Tax=Streptomyces sp. NPDC018031 TaxID=3365033 RepID=UPI0037AEB85B
MARYPAAVRRTGGIALGLLLGSTAVALLLAWRLDLDGAASLVGFAGGVTGLTGLWLAWSAYRDDRAEASGAVDLGVVADLLAVAVRRQWADEERRRQLNSPYPLPVSWAPAAPEPFDDWPSLVRLATTGAGWPPPPAGPTWAGGPAELAGTDGGLGRTLQQVPTGRLVVLGGPGAGKTVLLARLLLDLLALRGPGDPVPVLLSLASWDPGGQRFDDWLEHRLTLDHAGLAEPGPPGTGSRARALLDAGLLVLVLDGMDEIPEAARGSAVARLEGSLRPGQRLVLAARGDSYRSAVCPPDGTGARLTGAAGVELLPLDPAVVVRYLQDCAGGAAEAARWTPVRDALAASSAAGAPPPLAQALSTPLMAALARTVYHPARDGPGAGSAGSPADLLDQRDFPSRESLESHLCDGLVAAAYRDRAATPAPARKRAERAERWLMFLARDLERRRHGRTDLAWWELSGAVPAATTGLAVGLAAGLVGAAGLLLPMGLGCGLAAGALAAAAARARFPAGRGGISRALAGGLLGAVPTAFATQALFGPAAGVAGPGPAVVNAVAVGVAVAGFTRFRAGLAGGVAGGAAGTLVGAPDIWLPAQLVNGLGLGLAAGLVAGLASPEIPARGLRWSWRGLVSGPVSGAVLGLGTGLRLGPERGFLVAAVATATGAVVGGLRSTTTDLTTAAGPRAVLARDRTSFLVVATAWGLAVGVSAGCAVGLEFGPARGLGVAAADLVAVGLAVGFLQTCWGRYTVARCRLALTGRLPWRLMTFLADAHENRHLLRQSGAVYQFRHEALQRRLAERE